MLKCGWECTYIRLTQQFFYKYVNAVDAGLVAFSSAVLCCQKLCLIIFAVFSFKYSTSPRKVCCQPALFMLAANIELVYFSITNIFYLQQSWTFVKAKFIISKFRWHFSHAQFSATCLFLLFLCVVDYFCLLCNTFCTKYSIWSSYTLNRIY